MCDSMIDENSLDVDRLWVQAAEAAVRRYCGWHIAPALYTMHTLDGDGGRLLQLPTLKLANLEGLWVDGEDWVRYARSSERGMVELDHGLRFPNQLGSIIVDMTHGYPSEEVPDVLAIILTVARRGATQPAVASQAVNGASVSYFSIGGAPLSIPLLRTEKEALAPYRLRKGLV